MLCQRIANHREYLMKQFTTFHLRVSKAFPALIHYAIECTVILPLFCKSGIGVFLAQSEKPVEFYQYTARVLYEYAEKTRPFRPL